MQESRQRSKRRRSEIAEIHWKPVKREVKGLLGKRMQDVPGQYQFYALAVGPQGRYIARQSPEFKSSLWSRQLSRYRTESGLQWSATAEEAFNGLVSQLWGDGWEPVGSGKEWFDYRFRRSVTRRTLAAKDADGTVDLETTKEESAS